MTATYPQAEDEMFQLAQDAWDAGAPAIVGYTPELRFEGRESTLKPINDRYWARVSVSPVGEGQATLSDCVAVAGQKRYENVGNVFVQIFALMTDELGAEKARLLADLMKNAFRGKTTPSACWFKNCRFNKLANENKFFRYNVVAEYEFQEIG